MSQFPIAFCSDPARLSFALDNTARLLARWQAMREPDAIPRAEALDLRSIKSLLPEIIVFEVPDEMTVRYRLAGTEAVKRLGFEPRGMNLVDFMRPDMRGPVGRGFDLVARRKVGLLLHYTLVYGEDEEVPAPIEHILLPLEAPAGQPPRVLSLATRATFPHGRAPYGVREPTDRFEDVTFFDIGFGLPDRSTLPNAVAAA